MTDMESMAQNILGRIPAGKSGDAEKYMGLLQSPEGRQLLARMTDADKEALAKSGLAAAQGDSAAMRRVLIKLMSSKEGSSLIKQAMDIYQGKK